MSDSIPMQIDDDQARASSIRARKKHTRWTLEKTKIVEAMFDSGQAIKHIAAKVEMSTRSVQIYVSEHASDELGRPWIPFKPRASRKRPDSTRRKEILEIIREDNSLTQKQMIDRLPAPMKCSTRTLQKDLRELNITRKRLRHVPIERNDSTTILMRHDYALDISSIEDERLFFIDETGTNLHTNTNYGYQFRGITPILEERGDKGKNHSVVACIGLNGIVHWELKEGAYTSGSFCDFVANLLPMLPLDNVLVLDNAPIHKGRELRALVESSGRQLKFLPRYSPQLNPIEQFFAQYKAHQKAIRPRPITSIQLIESIERAMAEVRGQNMTAYYQDMRKYQRMALANKKFL